MIPENAIPPDLVAAKLAQAHNIERPDLARQLAAHPRIVELIWFLQWRSFQPGGITGFIDGLLSTFSDSFITAAMKAAGPARDGHYTLAQCLEVWREQWQAGAESRASRAAFDAYFREHIFDFGPIETPGPSPLTGPASFAEWLDLHYHGGLTTENVHKGKGCDKAAILEGAARFNWPFLKDQCEQAARRGLPVFLRDLCVRKHFALFEPAYCPDLLAVLFEALDKHADEAGMRLAKTEVFSKVFDALDYAFAERKFVRIDGNSRFGKTEAAAAWAIRYPGRARLVTVPCSNAQDDLIRAVAESLGISLTTAPGGGRLRTAVEFILRHGRLGLVFDEAHFLYPVRYGPHTVPTRLNWVRTAVIDSHLPCALITTPQAFEEQGKRFDRLTRYNMDQFTGRVSRHVKLPDILSKKDLAAVAEVHCAGFGKAELQMVIGAALFSRSYLRAVEDISSLARWKARQRKARSLERRDVQDAICEIVPAAAEALKGHSQATPATAAPSAGAPSADCPRQPRKTAADYLEAARPGARQTTLAPESETQEPSAGAMRPPGLIPV